MADNMLCLHCNSSEVVPFKQHPFPYMRVDKSGMVVESITKFHCAYCGKSYCEEYRHASDFGRLGDEYYFQRFSYGRYRYKDFTKPVFLNYLNK